MKYNNVLANVNMCGQCIKNKCEHIITYICMGNVLNKCGHNNMCMGNVS